MTGKQDTPLTGKKEVGNFTIVQHMVDTDDGRVMLAPLANIIAIVKNEHGGTVTLGLGPDMFKRLANDEEFVGGFILINAEVFHQIKKELEDENL